MGLLWRKSTGLLPAVLVVLAACASIEPAPVASLPKESLPAAAEPAPAPALRLATEPIADVVEEGAVALEGDWRFSVVPQFTPEMAAPDFDDSAWDTVRAPTRWADQGIGDLTGTGAVAVYRRTVDLPEEWQGQRIGISAWFYPYGAQVFVNGRKVEPVRTTFAPYADVTELVTPGAPAQITVVAQYDGAFDATDAAPARIGPLGERSVTKVLHSEGSVATPNGEAVTVLTHPEADGPLPGLVLVASGSHGLAELSAWRDVADELARAGYVSLAVALPAQMAEGVAAGVEALRANPLVDPQRVALWGVDAAATATLEASAALSGTAPLRGVVVLTPPMWNRLPAAGDQPLLLIATEQERGGLVLNQLTKLAAALGQRATVVALPGEGQGMFVIANVWNDLRAALLPWLAAELQ
jgi:dienelactone hydrolase